MSITRNLIVVAVHGEGDRNKVNADKAAMNKVIKAEHARARAEPPAGLDAPPDEAPDVLVVCRDADHHDRVELHLTDWTAVEAFKVMAGYDAAKRHWKTGASISLTLG